MGVLVTCRAFEGKCSQDPTACIIVYIHVCIYIYIYIIIYIYINNIYIIIYIYNVCVTHAVHTCTKLYVVKEVVCDSGGLGHLTVKVFDLMIQHIPRRKQILTTAILKVKRLHKNPMIVLCCHHSIHCLSVIYFDYLLFLLFKGSCRTLEIYFS